MQQARALVRDGGVRLRGHGGETLLIVAVGAYQLTECLRASDRLLDRRVEHAVVYLAEPGRFRAPRDKQEAMRCEPRELRELLFAPAHEARLFVTHTRPEPMLGALRPLDTGARTRAIGYRNQGGTLDAFGMMFANRATWAHVVAEAVGLLALDPTTLLSGSEMAAVAGEGDPAVLR
jgi:phosphoketolase